MLACYLDGKTFITIETDKESKFYLNNKELEANFVSKNKDTLIFKASNEVVLGKENILTNDFNEKATLQIRNFVKDEEFDEMFFYGQNDLGSLYTKQSTSFKLWAPTAYKVILEYHYKNKVIQEEMERIESGVYYKEIKKDLKNELYRYIVHVNGKINTVIDPYSYSCNANGKYSAVIDLKDIKDNDVLLPRINSITDCIIYELSIRDFSMDYHFSLKDKSTFNALTLNNLKSKENNPIGLDYLKSLGITHIQLMPVIDFETIDEKDKFASYNWGYDPYAFNVLEGSYSSNPDDPLIRMLEFKNMVETFHQNNLRVVMDVVFNHTFKYLEGLYNNIAPYYYYLMDRHQNLSNGSFCGNDIDTLRKMVRKYLLDMLRRYIEIYHIDGFRFDLMGILEKSLINKVNEMAKQINPSFIIYGEGWDMPSMLDSSIRASLKNANDMPGVSMFNDFARDTYGGKILDKESYKLGYLFGNVILADNFTKVIKGSISQDCYFNNPYQSINYVECHDNNTLFDKLLITRSNLSSHDRNKIQLTTIASIIFSMGVPFLHFGMEFNRTKNMLDNTYNLPDSINMVNWDDVDTYKDNIKAIQDFIQIRKEYDLFRFDTKEKVLKYIDSKIIKNGMTMFTIAYKGKVIIMIFNPTSNKQEVLLNSEHTILLNQYGKVNDDRTYQNVKVSSYGFIMLKK